MKISDITGLQQLLDATMKTSDYIGNDGKIKSEWLPAGTSGGVVGGGSTVTGFTSTTTPLDRFRAGIAANINNGGLDIVAYGDSHLEGYNGANPTYDSAMHKLKVKLQDHFNPAGVVGGYGFLPNNLGNGGGAWTGFGSFTQEGGQYGVVGKNFGGSGGEAGLYTRLDPAQPISKRMVANAVQFLGIRGFAYSRGRVDINVGTKPNIGAGSQTFLHNQYSNTGINGNQTNGGNRYGQSGFAAFDSKIDLNPTQDTYIQWAKAAAGDNNGIGSDVTAYEGAILYNGDFVKGIRLHDCSFFGRQLAGAGGQEKFMKDWHGSTTNGQFISWGRGLLTGGACNAKLYISDFITNDCGTGDTPNVDLATFTTALNSTVDYIVGLPSQPSLLYIIPPQRVDAVLSARTTNTWEQYRQAIYNKASTTPHMVIFDVEKYMGDQKMAASGAYADKGWWTGDNVHLTAQFQSDLADILYNVLIT
jgi:hypothetical protein